MALFELTARHPMYLGPASMIGKGERITMNIHTMGVQPHSIFSSPESRRQAIQQFAVNGIDIGSRNYLLNTGHWDIRQVQGHSFSKAVELSNPFEGLRLPWSETKETIEVVDDVQMKKDCIEMVKHFYAEGLDIEFAEKGLEGRCELATSFYDGVKKKMGIDAELTFAQKPAHMLGGFNPDTNTIELNMNYLEKPDCENLLNTILHESRHAFQDKCIRQPETVTVKENIIGVWKDNFVNYIKPEDDFEAYENQEIEKDANYFADSVMRKGTDYYA